MIAHTKAGGSGRRGADYLHRGMWICISAVLTACQPSVERLTPESGPHFDVLLACGEAITALSRGQAPLDLSILPQGGQVHDAIKTDNIVFVLRDDDLLQVPMSGGKASILVRFEEEVIDGAIAPIDHGRAIAFSTSTQSSEGHLGRQVVVSMYGLGDEGVRELTRESQFAFLRPLGTTQEGRSVLLVPYGGDPEFRTILEVDVASGERRDLAVEGSGEAVLDPTGRYLTTSATRFVPADQSLQYGLNLYDLSQTPLSAFWVDLPTPPSHAYDLVWSGEGLPLFLLVGAGTPYEEPPTSYGLWSLDPSSGEISLVIPISDGRLRLRTVDDEGERAILRPEVGQYVVVANLRSKQVDEVDVPQDNCEVVRSP